MGDRTGTKALHFGGTFPSPIRRDGPITQLPEAHLIPFTEMGYANRAQPEKTLAVAFGYNLYGTKVLLGGLRHLMLSLGLLPF